MLITAFQKIMRSNGTSVYHILVELSCDHIVLSLLAAIIVFICKTLIEQNTLGKRLWTSIFYRRQPYPSSYSGPQKTFYLVFIEHSFGTRLITYSVNPDFSETHHVAKSSEDLANAMKNTSYGSGMLGAPSPSRDMLDMRSKDRISKADRHSKVDPKPEILKNAEVDSQKV